MSRVYNVLTGAARPSVATPEAPDDGVWANEVDAPFIEIGGPGGPVFSAATTPPTPAPAKPEPVPEPPRNYPRLAPTPAAPAYLCVRFHDMAGSGNAKPGDGPDSSLVAFHHPEHAVSAEYRTLRDEIRKQHPEAVPRVLLFLAGAPESGTTTVLLNLGITLSGEGKTRVLVVDANVTHPAVAARLAIKPAPGLCEVLSQHAPLAWAVQPTAVPNLQVLAAGEAATATLGRDLPKLLGQLRQWYDWVLVDGGVCGQVPERDAVCPAADAVYLVTREAAAEQAEFAGLRGRVKELGGVLRGYIATRV